MPSLLPLDDLLGATFVGIMVSTVIYGITCLQVYMYFTEHCSRDSITLKTFVSMLFVLDTLHVALLAHVYYTYTVTNFGDYNQLATSTWSLLIQTAVGGFLSLFAQLFYVRQIYNLSGKRPVIPAIITLLALVRCASTLVCVVDGLSIHKFSRVEKFQAWAMTSLGLDIVCDTFITVSMIYYLRRNKTTFIKTNRMINLIIKYALNSCLLTTLCTAAALGLFAAKPNVLLYAPFFFVLIRLYSCSLMSTLNSRDYIRDQANLCVCSAMITIPTFGAASGETVGRPVDVQDSETTAPHDCDILERKFVNAA